MRNLGRLAKNAPLQPLRLIQWLQWGGGRKQNGCCLDDSDIVKLSLAAWAIKKYSAKLTSENEIQSKLRPLQSSIQRLESTLQALKIEIIDYEGVRFNDGLNVEIIDTIKSDTKEPTIRETIEPSVIFNGNLLHKARIIKEISKETE